MPDRPLVRGCPSSSDSEESLLELELLPELEPELEPEPDLELELELELLLNLDPC